MLQLVSFFVIHVQKNITQRVRQLYDSVCTGVMERRKKHEAGKRTLPWANGHNERLLVALGKAEERKGKTRADRSEVTEIARFDFDEDTFPLLDGMCKPIGIIGIGDGKQADTRRFGEHPNGFDKSFQAKAENPDRMAFRPG